MLISLHNTMYSNVYSVGRVVAAASVWRGGTTYLQPL